MTITAKSTLKELINAIGTVEKAEKTPTTRILRESTELLCSEEGCQVYANGYGVYDNGIGRTVVFIPSCASFTYHFIKETEELPEGLLESLPWTMVLTLVGDHRIEDNVMNRRQGSRKGSKDYKSQDDGDRDDSMEEAVEDSYYDKAYSWRDERFGEDPETTFIKKETREEMLERMTEKQREVFVLYYQMGYKQQEIAEMLNVDQTSVRDRLDAAIKKVKKLF